MWCTGCPTRCLILSWTRLILRACSHAMAAIKRLRCCTALSVSCISAW